MECQAIFGQIRVTLSDSFMVSLACTKHGRKSFMVALC